MGENNCFSNLKYSISRYFWEAKRGVMLRKADFYRELSPLERVFSKAECTLFSYGAVVGVGLHLILMSCIRYYGSMMIITVLLTVVETLISCMCYAELASLAPSTGAVYHYSYYTVGEFAAFMIGWNMLFAYIFSCSLTLRYLSMFMDNNLFQDVIRCGTEAIIGYYEPIGYSFFNISNNVVILTPLFSLCIAGLASITVRTGKIINNIFVITSIVSTYFCLLVYSFFINNNNTQATNSVPVESKGNQFDFFCASSSMAFCFCGYEVVACMGEEAIEPSKTIPKSILLSIKCISITYVLMTCFHTLLCSIGKLDDFHPVSGVLLSLGLWPFHHVATIAAITGMFASCYSSIFCITRIIYAMSRDGLLPKMLSYVSHNTKAPVVPAFFCGITVGICGMFFGEDTLGTISEVGIVISKVMATICLLITRYRCESQSDFLKVEEPRWILFNYPATQKKPTRTTENISRLLILNLLLSIISFVLVLRCSLLFEKAPYRMRILAICLLVLFIFVAACLYQQPQNDRSNLHYMIRGVPTIPILLIIYDIYTLTNIGLAPWIPITLWSLAGILFYFLYSVTHSNENRRRHADGRIWSIMGSAVQIDTHGIAMPNRTESIPINLNDSEISTKDHGKDKSTSGQQLQ